MIARNPNEKKETNVKPVLIGALTFLIIGVILAVVIVGVILSSVLI